ncbi:hypothetical protein [Cryobacterium ruanii]|uniref:Uncharacterized protein n=1 Tax=Cryobacterium ruanii TaxID=1259197 RepID=A0A4R9ALJ4_9MICO|nr:hypothetical protein [Cryobacterium ruanii]TFD64358.1 hypothetical protein E3T47_12905 [Cryobacterium ruanii]
MAALVVAARMRRSRLTSTAEGIGSFAVVLVLLDVWGVRQNNLFGLAAGDGALYWGIALLGCTALFLSWHARSNLRVGSVAGFAVAAPGFGLFAAGIFQSQDTLTRVYVGFLGAAVGALLQWRRFVENSGCGGLRNDGPGALILPADQAPHNSSLNSWVKRLRAAVMPISTLSEPSF